MESEKKPISKKLLLLGLIFIFVIIAFSLYLLFFKNYNLKLQPKKTPTPTVSSLPSPTEKQEPGTLTPSIVLSTVAPTVEPPTPTITPNPPTETPIPSTTPTPTSEPKADLYISEYSFDHPPKRGEPFTVRIGIYNKGNKAATSFWWEWWATSAIKPCREKIDSLVARGGRIVTCTYTYPSWSTYTTKAVADADNEVAESDESNNTQSQQVIPIH